MHQVPHLFDQRQRRRWLIKRLHRVQITVIALKKRHVNGTKPWP